MQVSTARAHYALRACEMRFTNERTPLVIEETATFVVAGTAVAGASSVFKLPDALLGARILT